jgi:hypothetical protein
MRNRQRRLTTLKRAGITLCSLIIVVWGLSAMLWVRVQTDRVYCLLTSGAVEVGVFPSRSHPGPVLTVRRLVSKKLYWTPRQTSLRGGQLLLVPLWIPLLPAAVLTMFVWHRGKPAPPNGCSACRYDLTGNTSGVCPECGERI